MVRIQEQYVHERKRDMDGKVPWITRDFAHLVKKTKEAYVRFRKLSLA